MKKSVVVLVMAGIAFHVMHGYTVNIFNDAGFAVIFTFNDNPNQRTFAEANELIQINTDKNSLYIVAAVKDVSVPYTKGQYELKNITSSVYLNMTEFFDPRASTTHNHRLAFKVVDEKGLPQKKPSRVINL